MRLIIVQNGRPLTVPLKKDRLVLGRHKSSDIQVHNPKISRHHIEIELRENSIKISDLNSRNGFQFKGEKLREAYLKHNDIFQIGSLNFIFQSHDDEIPAVEEIQEKREFNPIPLVVLIVSILLLTFLWNLSKNPAPIHPENSHQMSSVKLYLNGCESSINVFKIYFDDPSRHFSKLNKTFDLLDSSLKLKKLEQLNVAPALLSIFKVFQIGGHEWSKLNDIHLTQILTQCKVIETARKVTPPIRAFSQELKVWAESQLSAHNVLENLQRLSSSNSLKDLLTAWKQILSFEKDHIYLVKQEDIKQVLYKKIGALYLENGQNNLAMGKESLGKKELQQAELFGQGEDALKILAQFDSEAQQNLLINEAKKLYEQDSLLEAENLLKDTQFSNGLIDKAQALTSQISQRQILINLRTAFTSGNEAKLNRLIGELKNNQSNSVRHLIKKIQRTISDHQNGFHSLSQEDYGSSVKHFENVIQSLPHFDQKNHYKIDALKQLSLQTPNLLGQKHYQRGLSFLNQQTPDYHRARKDFIVAEKYIPSIAIKEIKIITDHVSDQITWYYSIRENSNKKAIARELENLQDCLTWLQAPQSDDDQSVEANTYRAIEKILDIK